MIFAIRMDPPVVAGDWPRCPRRTARTECGHVPPSAQASPGPGAAVTLTSRVLRRLLALRPRECKAAADPCTATHGRCGLPITDFGLDRRVVPREDHDDACLLYTSDAA